MNKRLFTSESVTEGHPDKVCDKISDSVLDAILAQDKMARVACETCCNTGFVMVMGEITTTAVVDIPAIVRKAVCDIGYTSSEIGFDGNTCAIMTSIDKQSPDIAMGVDTGGAGDQGLMFGFACNETPELMPLPIMLAHKITMKLSEVRKSGELDYLRPDGKSQVTIEYNGFEPVKVHTVVISSQHSDSVSMEQLKHDIIEKVIKPVMPAKLFNENECIFHINPTGRFVIGGPMGDCGLTGRKIIVDTYGGMGHHGGGAFSGKDATKVDRSAAYGARWVAKNIVAAGLAKRCEVQLAYAIGVSEPVSIMVNTFYTGIIPDSEIEKIVSKVFDLTPKGLISALDLRKPIFQKTASYGHFGRGEFAWEDTNKVADIKDLAGKLGS